MAEYIVREAVLQKLMRIPNAPKASFDIVCSIPAVDVAPVVRCGTRKHADHTDRADGFVWCMYWDTGRLPDGFCDRGAKMDLDD